MSSRYSLHQLHVFAMVAERASFSRAAAALHLTQPTVSMQVKQLAEALGVPLFEASARGGGKSRARVRLTPAASEISCSVIRLPGGKARPTMRSRMTT